MNWCAVADRIDDERAIHKLCLCCGFCNRSGDSRRAAVTAGTAVAATAAATTAVAGDRRGKAAYQGDARGSVAAAHAGDPEG